MQRDRRLDSWPLARLPDALAQALVARLPQATRRSLRLTCKDGVTTVDAATRRLGISRLGPFKQGLVPRFSGLTQLELSGEFVRHARLEGDSSALVHGEAWLSVKELHLWIISARAATAAIASCPNVEALSISAVYDIHCGPSQLTEQQLRHAGLATIHHACSNLQWLGSLATFGVQLGDAELQALAGCPSLVHLDSAIGTCTEQGWQAFMGLQLRSLELHKLDPCALPTGALASWALGMRSLTALSLLGLGPQQPQVVELRLPPSLVALTMSCGLPLPAFSQPALRSLHFEGLLQDRDLAHLAHGCPLLSDLTLDYLTYSSAFDTTSLSALTHLTVDIKADLSGVVTWAAAFPALQHFRLKELSTTATHTSTFSNMSMLTCLKMGYMEEEFQTDYDAWSLSMPDFEALALVPCLQELHLNATIAQVRGVSLLPALRTLTFKIGSQLVSDGALAELESAFCTSFPPLNLHVVFDFVDDAGWRTLSSLPSNYDDIDVSAFETGLTLSRIAAAAQSSWLVRAPALTFAFWRHDEAGCAAFTDIALAAVATNESIVHIELGNGSVKVTPSMLQYVMHKHAKRQLRVVVRPAE